MKKIKIFNLEIKRDHLESKDVIEVKNFQENKDFLDNKNLIENIEILGNLDNPDNLDNLESLDKKNNKKKKDKILIIGKVREIVKSRIIQILEKSMGMKISNIINIGSQDQIRISNKIKENKTK